jgi:hypothetical protein
MSLKRTPAPAVHPEMVRLDDRIVPSVAPVTTANDLLAVGSDPGNAARVHVYDSTGALKYDFLAYSQTGYVGGVRVVTADMNGDGVDDIITAPGPGMRALIRVYDGVNGEQILAFNAFDPKFTGGAYLAVGDFNGDGRADLVVGAGDTGASHVKIFDGQGLFPPLTATAPAPGPDTNIIRQFFAYNLDAMVGARVAVADVNGDGQDDIITGAGPSGGPHVRVFNGADGTLMREFFAYDTRFTGGVYVAAGDLDGDGKAEVVTGMGAKGNGTVNVYDGNTGKQIRTIAVSDAAALGASVRVGVLDTDHNGDNEIVLGVRSEIRYLDGKTYVRTGGMTPFDPGYIGGVFFG